MLAAARGKGPAEGSWWEWRALVCCEGRPGGGSVGAGGRVGGVVEGQWRVIRCGGGLEGRAEGS